MSDIQKIANLMKELGRQLAICTYCGMCQAVCPLFLETGREPDVARGKLALLDGLRQEMFKNPDGVQKRLNRCLLCGSCAANCPRSVNLLEIFIKARMILASVKGLSFVEKVILRGVLAHPVFFNRMIESVFKIQNLFIKPANELLGTSCMRSVSPLLKNRHFMPLASVPFHRRVPFLNTPAKGSGIKIAFFTGCLIDNVFPNVAESVINIMKYHGVGVFIPEGLGCCGIPAVSSGDMATFNRLVLHNLEKFDAAEYDYLVTACATCTFIIKKIWPLTGHLTGHENSIAIKTKINTISEKTMDINQFLVSKIGLEMETAKNNKDAILVTYHDPCHLKKSLGVSFEPRAIINSNKNYRLTEMAEPDHCCGMGGTFNLEHYDLSNRIGKRKLENIKATGCKVVATGCPACMMQILDMISKSKKSVAVKHPVEIYAEALKTCSLQKK